MDYVREVTTSAAYQWDPDDRESAVWSTGEAQKHRQLCRRCGIASSPTITGSRKTSCAGCARTALGSRWCPRTATAKEVLALNPDGVFLSNGPGDPSVLDYAHQAVRDLVGQTPIFGICLGHQMLGFAFGGRTFKLKFGHRGGNQPVKDLTHWQSRDHFAESRLRGRSRFAPVRSGSDARESERRHSRRNAAPRVADLQRAISSRGGARSARRRLFLRAVRATH